MAPKNTVDAKTVDALLSLDNQFCFALHAASRLVVRAYRPVLRDLDLTYSQYLVLLVLWEWERTREPRPTVHQLGERLDLDSGTLTPLLRRLEQKGLLARERSSVDGRELFVRASRAGRALKKRARDVPIALICSSPLPAEDMVALRDQLQRMRQVMAGQENTAESA